jgi:RNA polymerase-associated protein
MLEVYSWPTPNGHKVHIMLEECDLPYRAVPVDIGTGQQFEPAFLAISPNNKVPVLVERDLVLYEANIINEYIDERFPHPQLMPPDPVMRARARLVLHNFENDLFVQVNAIEHGSKQAAEAARIAIRDSLTQLTPILDKQKYLMNDEFSMLDVAIAPLLWRLEHYDIHLPKQAASVLKYRERLFSRPAFIEAMTPTEKAMRK